MWTDLETERDMTKLTVTFRNFANALKNLDIFHSRNIGRKTKLSHLTSSPFVSNSPFQIWYYDAVKKFRVVNLVNEVPLYPQEQRPHLIQNILCYDGVTKILLAKTFDILDWPLPFCAYEGNIGISDIISDTYQNRNAEQNWVSRGYK